MQRLHVATVRSRVVTASAFAACDIDFAAGRLPRDASC